MASDKVCILSDQDDALAGEILEDDDNLGISFSNSTLVFQDDDQSKRELPSVKKQREKRVQESREQSGNKSLNESEDNSSISNPSEDFNSEAAYRDPANIIPSEDSKKVSTKKDGSKSNPIEDSTVLKTNKNRSESDPSKRSFSSSGSINFTGSLISPVIISTQIESAKESTEDDGSSNKDEERFEIVRIPDESEMEVINSSNDPQNEEQILENIDIYKSWYKYPLIFSGLLGSERSAEKKSKRDYPLWFRRILIIILFVFLLVFKFNGLFEMSWMLLETKFPFTLINDVVWELRWILTFCLCGLTFMDGGGFDDFLSHVEISRKKWYQNAKRMRIYICVVFVSLLFS